MPEHPAPAQQATAPASPVAAAVAPAPALPPGPGLLVIAKAEDTLQSLYNRVYKGLQAPPFEVVEAMNPHEIKLGDVVVFPAPPGGWHRLPNTAGR
jgi:nucleoid-associated protein YgaU